VRFLSWEENHMNVSIVSQVNYGNAEVRGQLRAWKQKLARDYTAFESTFRRFGKGGDLGPLLFDMIRCGRIGRQRAFEKINRALGPGAKLETKHLDDKSALAVWSIFCPRSPVWCATSGTAPDAAQMGLSQNCVTVNYIAAGAMPWGVGLEQGLWTLGVPDHALGRAIERSRFLHPGAIIREAHVNLLNLPAQTIALNNGNIETERGFFVKAGAGAFRCEMQGGPDKLNNGELGFFAFTRTWIDAARLHEDQVPLHEKGKPGNRLGDTWLLPHPLRRIIEVATNQAQVIPLRQLEYAEHCPDMSKLTNNEAP
jgi:hypothetical protein